MLAGGGDAGRGVTVSVRVYTGENQGHSQQVSSPETSSTSLVSHWPRINQFGMLDIFTWVLKIGLRSLCLQGEYFPDQTLTPKVDIFYG